MAANYVAEKLANLALKGNMDAYIALGYVLRKKVNENGCWTLDGKNLHENGYTFFSLTNRRAAGHRLLLEILQESPVPEGMVVDHMCHNEAAAKRECSGGLDCPHRACFNPDHMEITTQQINVARGSKGFWNQDACPQGHERSEQNTRIDSLNHPVCRLCHNHHTMLAKRAWRARKKVTANG